MGLSSSSDYIVTVIDVHVTASTETTFEHISRLDLYSFWAFVHFMADHSTSPTDYCLQGGFSQLLEQDCGLIEILLYEDFRVVICASASFLTVSVYVVPT